MSQMFAGRCLCGAVEYQITGEPKRFHHCHCQRCRKATGTGHASNLFVSPSLPEKITWIKGENLVVRYKVPDAERFTNSFCGQCGGRMPRYVSDLDVVMIPAGSLDIEPAMAPQARIFWDSRAPWSCDAGDLPVHSEYPANN